MAKISDGLVKLDRIGFEGREAAQAEIIRKMVIAMARDIRVLVIKLADRLHNMRDVGYLDREAQERKAREVLEIYAPLANRLGIHQIKWELEDLAFATLYPLRYEEIARMTAERAPAREQYVAEVIEQVNAQLKQVKLRAVVSGRPKHYYSIYEKMVVRGKEFTDIFDLVGVRILVDSIKDCYAALGQVHAVWKPVPGRFKDYIAMPKFNLYQSLHTTVVGPQGKPLEIQIRTKAMHRTAEYGVAAHWRYKSKDGKPATEQEMGWLRQLIDWQRELSDPRDFIENLDTDLYVDEVFVFTPKGDVIQLPAGATPIDFAYAVHTEVGHRCVGARVNKRLVPLEHALENGDNVEIFTSKAQDAGPSRDWLGIVKTPRARNKIRQWFAKERREDAIEAGKDSLVRAMRKAGLPLQKLTQGGALTALAADMRFASLEAFYAAVGSGQTSAQAVVSASRPTWAASSRRTTTTTWCWSGPSARPGPSRPAGAWSSRASTTSGSSWPAAAPRCPATRSSASSPAATASASTARTAPTPTTCAATRTASSRSSGTPRGRACSRSPSRSRPWTGPSCCATSPRSSPTTTSTSCRPRWPPAATGCHPALHLRAGRHLPPGPRPVHRQEGRGRLRRLPGRAARRERQRGALGAGGGLPGRLGPGGGRRGADGGDRPRAAGPGRGHPRRHRGRRRLAGRQGGRPAGVRRRPGQDEPLPGEVGGGALVVSQFTLYGDARKGRRPSYVAAAPPEQAAPLVEAVAKALAGEGVGVATGRFGAEMRVESAGDGPVTILLDSSRQF